MRFLSWQVILGLALVAASALLYGIHYLIFGDSHHIFIYMLGDIAFLPIEVLLVTLIIHRLLSEREKRALLEKMNMVIGAFFSEAGVGLLKDMTGFCREQATLTKEMELSPEWTDKDFKKAASVVKALDMGIDCRRADLTRLKGYLLEKRGFIIRLLENPILLEHESFTDLLWAVLHLTEELSARADLEGLPPADYAHLTEDMRRVYGSLAHEWLHYQRHLKRTYPFLYSFYVRMNPLRPDASPLIRS